MSTHDLPPIVGLTGGIGSGKSTVSTMFEDLGVTVIDADVISREVVAPGSTGLDEIREHFGDDILTPEGSLDRARLGEIVFQDASARKALEDITHPLIGERMLHYAAEAGARGEPWVIYDAALLVENGLHEAFHSLVVVSLEREQQIKRVVERDGLDRADVERRIASQMPLEEKVAVADYVIDNSGTLEDTREQVVETKKAIDASIETK